MTKINEKEKVFLKANVVTSTDRWGAEELSRENFKNQKLVMFFKFMADCIVEAAENGDFRTLKSFLYKFGDISYLHYRLLEVIDTPKLTVAESEILKSIMLCANRHDMEHLDSNIENSGLGPQEQLNEIAARVRELSMPQRMAIASKLINCEMLINLKNVANLPL